MLFCVLPLPSRAAGAAPSVDLGVGLGGGATGYTVENLHQNGAAEESLKAVVKWRQDALNDTSVKWNGKTMKQYLADNDISESDYLNPKWSNALERIAIQRAIEAWDYNDGHTRPMGRPVGLHSTVRIVHLQKFWHGAAGASLLPWTSGRRRNRTGAISLPVW